MTFSGIPFWAVAVLVLGSAGVLALLHLLRVHPRELRVTTTLFWIHAVEKTRARTLLEKFRHPLTYALLLLVLALLSFALGEPRRTGESKDRISEVVIVDAGMSMAAGIGGSGQTRWDAARRLAIREADRLSLNDRLAVVVADPLPRLVHGFDDPRPMLRKELATLTPAAGPALVTRAVALARSLLAGRPNPSLVLITDRPLEAGKDVRLIRVGAPVANAGILSAMFEPDAQDPCLGTFRVRIGCWGDQAAETTLQVHRGGGAPLLNQACLLSPGRTQEFSLPALRADGDQLQVALLPEDAMPADNHVSFRLPLRKAIRVSIQEAVPTALRQALESYPWIRVVADNDKDSDITVRTDSPGRETAGPAIVVTRSGSPVPPGRTIEAVDAALDFEGAVCGGGFGLDPQDRRLTPLLRAQNVLLAGLASQGSSPRLYLGSALLTDQATVTRRAAFAVFLARNLQALAGWNEDPVVLTAERTASDPLWARRSCPDREAITLAGSREAGNLWVKEPAQDTLSALPARWSAPAPFETLLVLAVACFLLEGILHARGRIS